ncbi:MAG TPA: hypothetical protein VKR58_04175 [Aquella sp.]|nr:hypothetical protein [Aquella sp.]
MKKYSLNSSILKLSTILFLGVNVAHAYKKHIVCNDPDRLPKQIVFAFDFKNTLVREHDHTSYLLTYPKDGSSGIITELAGIHGETEVRKIPNNQTDFSLNTELGAPSFVRFYQKELVYVEGVSKENMVWSFYKISYVKDFLAADKSEQEFRVQLYPPNTMFGPRPPEWSSENVSKKDGWILWKNDESSPRGSFTQLVCKEA